MISDLYKQAKQGNKISYTDFETLTFLLSRDNSSKSFFDEYLKDVYTNQGMDKQAIKQEEIAYSNVENLFEILKSEMFYP